MVLTKNTWGARNVWYSQKILVELEMLGTHNKDTWGATNVWYSQKILGELEMFGTHKKYLGG